VGDLVTDFVTGTGPEVTFHGPDDAMTQQLMNAPGVNAARDWYYAEDSTTLTNFKGSFGLIGGEEPYSVLGIQVVGWDGLLSARSDMTRQFVGSYRVDIVPVAGGQLMFMVTNQTTVRSLFYQLPTVQAYGRSDPWAGAPSLPYGGNAGGTTYQMYYWTEPLRPGGGGW
jgi:hypothetical protein